MVQPQICPNCKAQINTVTQFCTSCGFRLNPPPNPPTGIPTVSPPSSPPVINYQNTYQQPSNQPGYQQQNIPYNPPTYPPNYSNYPAIPAGQAGGQASGQYSVQPTGHPGMQGNYFSTRIDRLGILRDKWSGVIAGAAGKADVVLNSFEVHLNDHQLPAVHLSREVLTPGGMMGKRRLYQLTRSQVGATMAIYIGGYGTDLFFTWNLFIRMMWKWLYLGIMAGITLILALITTSLGHGFSFFVLITSFFSWCIPVIGIAMVAGKILKGNTWAFFIEIIDDFEVDDIMAMMMIVHQTLLSSLEENGLTIKDLTHKHHFTIRGNPRII